MFKLDEDKTRSSCPYEGGAALDNPAFSVTNNGNSTYQKSAYISGVDPNDKALFRIKLANNSPEKRVYNVRLKSNTNPDAAIVKYGDTELIGATNSIASDSINGNGGFETLLISLEKGPDDLINDYGPITLVLYSPCDPGIQDTITISANFLQPLSLISIKKPPIFKSLQIQITEYSAFHWMKPIKVVIWKYQIWQGRSYSNSRLVWTSTTCKSSYLMQGLACTSSGQ
ncbi:MAG: hypothetical protein R2769_10585 [Saprospiraceae bacterium]